MFVWETFVLVAGECPVFYHLCFSKQNKLYFNVVRLSESVSRFISIRFVKSEVTGKLKKSPDKLPPFFQYSLYYSLMQSYSFLFLFSCGSVSFHIVFLIHFSFISL